MKTCGHVVLYALDFAKQCVPVRPDGCLICEKDELESKLDAAQKRIADQRETINQLTEAVALWMDRAGGSAP